MTTNLDLESKVIERFVTKSKKERYLTFIKSDKNRKKFLKELSHFNDLKRDLFEEIKGNELQILRDRIKSLGNIKDCYIISELSEFDQKRHEIDSALSEVIGRGMGTIIVFGDAEMIFYEEEGPSVRWISKQINK